LPSVIASTPSPRISFAVFWVMPTPPAAFSPLTTTKSGAWRSRSAGSSAASVRRPRPPTTSATNRSFIERSLPPALQRYRPAAMADPVTAEPEAPIAAVLQADGLTKRYGDREALRDVSLSAGRGELVAVIGPNGAGKTTLLSILAGIQPPDSGSVSRAPEEIGWVPQQAAVYGKLTVRENIELFARLERVDDPAATVDRMLDLTGLRDRADDQVGELSGGNRQRVNIAVGLLGGQPVLLLDEPSAALDPRQRQRVWEFILSLAEAGTTVVYSTHNIQEAERHAQRVLVLADGELLFSGSPRELERAVERERGPVERGDFEEAFVAFLRQRGH